MPHGMSWNDYNESLVERGRILFDLGFAENWKKELKLMNKSKVGRPFDFPDSYIEFLDFIKVGFDAPYRVLSNLRVLIAQMSLVRTRHVDSSESSPARRPLGSFHRRKEA